MKTLNRLNWELLGALALNLVLLWGLCCTVQHILYWGGYIGK